MENVGDIYTKWYWDYSGNLKSADVKLNWDGNYYHHVKGKIVYQYTEDLFNSELEAYDWKLESINSVITKALKDKAKLVDDYYKSIKLTEDGGIPIGSEMVYEEHNKRTSC
jgi:hypothetical protein